MTKLLTYLTALLIFLRLVLAEQPHRCNGNGIAWEIDGHHIEPVMWIWK